MFNDLTKVHGDGQRLIGLRHVSQILAVYEEFLSSDAKIAGINLLRLGIENANDNTMHASDWRKSLPEGAKATDVLTLFRRGMNEITALAFLEGE